MTRVFLRLEIGATARLGPGKARLLELVADRGSIAAAARGMGMSYRRAWLLVDSLNSVFKTPVVATRLGGPVAGRAELTPFGRELLGRYRAMEAAARAALAADLALLEAELQENGPLRRDPLLPQG